MKREILKSLVPGDKPYVFIDYDRTPVDLARRIAREQFAWPGGYELCAVMDDGGLVCSACVRANYRNIIHDTKHGWNTGWRVEGITSEAELENCSCDHCDKPLGYQSNDEEV